MSIKVQGTTIIDDTRVIQNLRDNISVIAANVTAVANSTTYVLNIPTSGNIVVTLPASPTTGDWVKIINASNTLTCNVARNSANIMSLAQDMTVDVLNASFELVYSGNATLGWQVF